MRRQAVAWERAAEVREAAARWYRTGTIDEACLAAIRVAYPDPCVTPSLVWRVLAAVMVSAVTLAGLGAVLMALQPDRRVSVVLVLFAFAAAAFVLTEGLDASPRHTRRGLAGATSFWGCVLTVVGAGLMLHADRSAADARALSTTLVVSAAVWAAACWRWGPPVFAAASAVSVFALLGRLPAARTLWLLVGLLLAVAAVRLVSAEALAPSHRRATMVLVVAGLLAAYVAVNPYSLDERVIEGLRGIAPGAGTPGVGRLVFGLGAAATAILPLAVLAWALRARWTLLLDVGIVLLALSLVTLRHYVSVGPLWLVLIVSGGLLTVLAVAVERVLGRRPGREYRGFTAAALFADERRQRLLQGLPVVTGLAPPPSAPVAEEGFSGQGGQFGGGGASDRY